MSHTDPSIEPPLPDLDDIISQVGEWEECFFQLVEQPSVPLEKYVAFEAFAEAYIALSKAQQAIELMESES